MVERPPARQGAGGAPAGPRLSGEIVRQRLIDRLAMRWAVPVTLLEAPGGFGKSIAIAQAVQANRIAPRGTDLLHTCRSPDREASVLGARLSSLLGISPPGPATAVDELAGLLVARLVDVNQEPLAIVLDDVHQLRDDDGAVALLDELVRSLPAHVHLVLAGRRIPSLPLTRLMAADQLVRLTEDELAFAPSELEQMADLHGTDPRELEQTAGWPALARLAAVVGASAPLEYLIEEVLHGLDTPTRAGLAAAVLGCGTDDVVLAEIADASVTTHDLVGTVPLVHLTDDGGVHTHDLWSEVLDAILEPTALREVALRASIHHHRAGRHEEAILAAVAVEAWEQARTVVLDAPSHGDSHLSTTLTERWLALFPPDQHDEPELRLLCGISARLAGDLDTARAHVEASLEALEVQGRSEHRASAALEVGLVAWLQGDLGRAFDMVRVAEELQVLGVTSMDWLLHLARAAFADLQGDVVDALALVELIDADHCPGPMAQIVLRWRSMLRLLLGDSAGAVADAQHLSRRFFEHKNQNFLAYALWHDGDPSMVLADPDAATSDRSYGNAREDFLAGVMRSVVASSLGRAPQLGDVPDLATDRGRDRAYLVAAQVVQALHVDDEVRATQVVEQFVDEGALDNPMARPELLRFATLTAPLSPRVAEALDGEASGPLHHRRLGLVRVFRAARAGTADWSDLPAPTEVLTGLPLRWSLELAARAAAHGSSAGIQLADHLVETVGEPARALLDAWRARGDEIGRGVQAIDAALPPRPAAAIRVITCGSLVIEGIDDTSALRRARVRELLGLLVLRERITVDQAAQLLWPGLGPEKRRNNLRLTLSYLRALLEPDRAPGQLSFHLRRDGDHLVLARSALLSTDLWDISDLVERGRGHEAAGRTAEAMVVYRSTADLWTGDLLVDLRDHHELAAEVTHLDLLLGDLTARLAEWYLTQGDDAEAERFAQHLLTHDPYAERAHAVIISALLGRGDHQGAVAAAGACREALAELGARPSDATALLLDRVARPERPGMLGY